VSLFVVGTDGGVGKTVVAAVVLARYRALRRLVYWQPIAAGARLGRDRDTVAALVPGVETAAESYLFDEPVAPHLAARHEGSKIELARISARWRELRTAFEGAGFVVEGVDGLLVPLDESGTLLADLVAAMALPALVVARSTVGGINHTLLTVEALRARAIEVVGVVLNGAEQPAHREAIERSGGVEVIAELPALGSAGASLVEATARGFDPDARLARWLEP
jgi:dethiobiotin synthase